MSHHLPIQVEAEINNNLLPRGNSLFPLFVFNIKVRRYGAFFLSKRYSLDTFGGVAQLGEHLPCKQGVSGSIPLISTITIQYELYGLP